MHACIVLSALWLGSACLSARVRVSVSAGMIQFPIKQCKGKILCLLLALLALMVGAGGTTIV